jgi:aminoglycoside/choline kinase family phosphotransferase
MSHEQVLRQLFQQYFKEECRNVTRLPQAGSDRIYYRLASDLNSVVGTYGKDASENEAFIHHTRHFRQKDIAVPQVFEVSSDKQYYLQQDLGDVSLYSIIKQKGITDDVIVYLKEVLHQLAFLQIKGSENFDFSSCYPIKRFNRSSMFWDLNSFKYYFARIARAHFSEVKLNKDFHWLCDYLLEEKNLYFMFRDCQSRNVMINGDKIFFIDYQGGRKGALQYDAASLLWQAGAKIPYATRDKLFDFYADKVAGLVEIDKQDFKDRYNAFVLIRMLQVLGAYGFRGLIERRAHFIESIIPAIDNIRWFLENVKLKIELPELYSVLQQLCQSDFLAISQDAVPDTIQHYHATPHDNKNKKLIVEVNSFSYRRGIPEDKSGNGGGFVFDCRGLHNPGRYEPYKAFTGKDTSVIEFLEAKSKAKEFLQNVYKVIDFNIQDYLERDFEHLQINFGCTGGQHRSVYCAEQTAKYVREKYHVKVELKHIEREILGHKI